MSKRDVLIFMHIPKTGGTTLSRIIDMQYKPNEIYRTYKNVVKAQGKMTDNNIRCIQGHDYFGIHKQINKPFKYVTLLRDPVERVISNYYYSRQFIKNCPSFEEFRGILYERYYTFNYHIKLQSAVITRENHLFLFSHCFCSSSANCCRQWLRSRNCSGS
ncbi:sulfotransferase family 2 domain-containing protein [Bacillus sp. J33]|uniref:sulfotransferase family 2 domain-containing protein n=1 Tax=Bacillus sp. J33 TaxID=935836 RepID=UPI000687DD0F|nr:sulfotransferase family 2 domain-containing protein [Bacillus sp. J33]